MAKFCPACGAELKGKSKFCAGCGSPLPGAEQKTVGSRKTAVHKSVNARQLIKIVIVIGIIAALIFIGNVIVKKMRGSSCEEPFRVWEEGINTQNQEVAESAFLKESLPYAGNMTAIIEEGVQVQIDVLAEEEILEEEMQESMLRKLKELGADKATYVGVKMTIWSEDKEERMSKLLKIMVLRVKGKWYLTTETA